MAKSISLKIDVKGQDELFAAQKGVNDLTKSKKALNKQYKDGTITEKAYAKELSTVNVNLKASKTRVNQLNKALLEKNKIVKKSGSFTGKMAGAMGKMVVGIGAAIAGFKALGAAVSGSIAAYDQQMAAQKSLEVALGGTSEALLQQARALQQTTRFGDESIIQGQAYLAQMGLNEKQIGELTPAILDMAAAQGMNLDDAMKLAAKTMGSSTNALSRYGVEVEGAVGSQARLDSMTSNLTSKFEGQAEAMAGVGSGSMIQFKNAVGDLMEKGGGMITKFINPFIQKMTKWMPKVPLMFTKVSNKVKELYNWFVELYNESVAFRAIIQYIKFSFKNVMDVMRNQLTLLVDIFKAAGTILHGVFTFNFSKIKQGYQDVGNAVVNMVKNTAKDVKENYEEELSGLSKRTAKKLVLTPEDSTEVVAEFGDLGKEAGEEFGKEVGKSAAEALKEAFDKAKEVLTKEQLQTLTGIKQSYILELKELNNQEFETEKAKQEAFKKLKQEYAILFSQMKQEDLMGLLTQEEIHGQDTLQTANKILDGKIKILETEIKAVEAKTEIVKDKDMEAALTGKQGAVATLKGVLKAEAMEATAGFMSSILKGVPFPANIVLAAGASFAVSQLFDKMMGGIPDIFASGGIVHGKSHSSGGEKFGVGGRVVELEGGEAVINKRSTAMFRNTLSSINSAGGGIKFADGGILNQMQGGFDMAGTAGGGIGGQVVVVESDITSSQNMVNTIQTNASL